MPPLEREVLGEGKEVVLGEEVALGEVAGEGAIGVKDPDPPVHVVPGVPPRPPRGGVEAVEGLLPLGEVLGQGPKPPSPFLEAQGQKGLSAHLPAPGHGLLHGEALRRHPGEDLPRARVPHGDALALAFPPLAHEVALELHRASFP